MSTPAAEFRALKRSAKEFEARFLSAYLAFPPSLDPPRRKELLDVAACVVLIHGALENFVEGLALWVLDRSVSNWTNSRRASRCTASLLLFHGPPPIPDEPTTIFDNLRVALAAAKESVSRSIHENNGISPRHLRVLFYPLGVDVPTDAVQTASLDLLVRIRHQWAHQFRFGGAQVLRSARDIQLTINDCIAFADDLRQKVAAARP
jgi:hypothetical protein